jgi:hypothetical protein
VIVENRQLSVRRRYAVERTNWRRRDSHLYRFAAAHYPAPARAFFVVASLIAFVVIFLGGDR